MKVLKMLWSAILSALALVGVVPLPTAAASMVIDGDKPNPASLVGILASLALNAAPGPGDPTLTSNAAATFSPSAAQVINGILINTTAATVTLPQATVLIAQLPNGQASAGSVVGRNFLLRILNTATPGTCTLATNTGLTLVGTMVVSALTARWYLGQVTSATQVTFTELAGWTIVA